MTLPQSCHTVRAKQVQYMSQIASYLTQVACHCKCKVTLKFHTDHHLLHKSDRLLYQSHCLHHIKMGGITGDTTRQDIRGVRPLPCEDGQCFGNGIGEIDCFECTLLGRFNLQIGFKLGNNRHIKPFDMVLYQLTRPGKGSYLLCFGAQCHLKSCFLVSIFYGFGRSDQVCMVTDAAHTRCDDQRIPGILPLYNLFNPPVEPKPNRDIIHQPPVHLKIECCLPLNLLYECFDVHCFHLSYSNSFWVKRLILKLFATPVRVR